MVTKVANKGASLAKQLARDNRKSANPKSQRGNIAKKLVTKGEAIEQATIKRAGIQGANKASIKAKAVESGVKERLARNATKRTEASVVKKMASRAASQGAKGALGAAGKALSRFSPHATALGVGYAVGEVINSTTPVQKWIREGLDKLETKPSMTTTVPKKKATTPTRTPVAPATKATVVKSATTKKATPTKVSSAPADKASGKAIKRQEFSAVKDVGEAPTASAPSKEAFNTKKDIQFGAIAGRKAGTWHLGRKVGKG